MSRTVRIELTISCLENREWEDIWTDEMPDKAALGITDCGALGVAIKLKSAFPYAAGAPVTERWPWGKASRGRVCAPDVGTGRRLGVERS